MNAPLITEQALLHSKELFFNPAATVPATHMYQQLVLEWEAIITGVAGVDETLTGMGLCSAPGSSARRDQNNIAMFSIVSDALRTLTDNAGTETETAITGAPTLTDIHTYKIVVRAGAVDFYVDGVLKNTHTTNLPASVLAVAFALNTTNGSAASIDVRSVRCYFLDA